MNRLRTIILTLGLSLSLVLSAVAAPQETTKKGKAATTTTAEKKAGTTAEKKADTKGTAKAAPAPPGPGYVWVNKDSKIFHREGSRFYGKTKNGEYMKESDAIAQGYREAGKAASDTKAGTTKADKKAAAAAAGKK